MCVHRRKTEEQNSIQLDRGLWQRPYVFSTDAKLNFGTRFRNFGAKDDRLLFLMRLRNVIVKPLAAKKDLLESA